MLETRLPYQVHETHHPSMGHLAVDVHQQSSSGMCFFQFPECIRQLFFCERISLEHQLAVCGHLKHRHFYGNGAFAFVIGEHQFDSAFTDDPGRYDKKDDQQKKDVDQGSETDRGSPAFCFKKLQPLLLKTKILFWPKPSCRRTARESTGHGGT